MNPLIYSMAVEDCGYDFVHQYIGKEPSGHKYNSIVLNNSFKPHNPCTNAGAMVVCSLYQPRSKDSERIKSAMNKFSQMAGDTKINFDNQTYLSEKDASDVNRALSYFLAAKSSFPPNTDYSQTLDYYLQLCSLELDNKQLACIAATYANYGICPLTGKKVLSTSTAIRTNQIMFSCGMFDYSGEWACTVGLPGNSGISGNLLITVPGVCGISIYSPLVNESGNSVRGVEFGKEIVKRFNWNTFDVLESSKSERQIE
jgi:glutaminase